MDVYHYVFISEAEMEAGIKLLRSACLPSVSLRGSYKQGQEGLLGQLHCSLRNIGGLQLAMSGDLRHSIASLSVVPSALGLDGALEHSDALIAGRF